MADAPSTGLHDELLFCDPRFHDLNAVAPEHRWRYAHTRDGALVGVLDGTAVEGVLTCGASAPFAGPDLARPDPTVEDVLGLVDGALAAADEDGLHTVRIRARPPAYAPHESLIEYVLLHRGFTVEHCDLNQHVDLAPLRAGGDPLSLLGKKRARDVRADLRLPYELTDVTADPRGAATAHALLAANRAEHGRPPGLPLDYLLRASTAFPGRVAVLLLSYEQQPVAAAVVYRVLREIDLLVAWGDTGHRLQRSPMNLLAHHLVVRSAAGGARLLDLGPSSEKDGTPNLGLAHFKRSVGATTGTRKVLLRSRSDGTRLLGPLRP